MTTNNKQDEQEVEEEEDDDEEEVMAVEESGLCVPKSRMIQLIHLHLVENGLYDASRALQMESGIGLAGCTKPMLVRLEQMVRSGGQWGSVLKLLDTLDPNLLPISVLCRLYELCLTELIQIGETELAHATFQIICNSFQQQTNRNNNDDGKMKEWKMKMEQLLSSSSVIKKITKEERNALAAELKRMIPLTPSNRLVSLIQQSLKWQSYTGQLPLVDDNQEEEEEEERGGLAKKSSKKRKRKRFDLVLGSVQVEEVSSSTITTTNNTSAGLDRLEKNISRMWSTLKMTKGSFVECCSFIPMGGQGGVAFLTGTTDGFIELWDASQKYTKLLPTPYQTKDEIMTLPEENAAVTTCAVTNDATVLATGTSKGRVYLWNLQTGQCLRRLECSSDDQHKLTCLQFHPSGKLLLTSANTVVREWGLRAGGKLLKEFRGHESIVSTCLYSGPSVLTASLDGTVRLWDARSAQIQHILSPHPSLSIGSNSSISTNTANHNNLTHHLPIITVLPLHTPPNSLLIVPRSTHIYIVTFHGVLVRKYELPDIISAATISSSNQWFYATTENKKYLYVLDMVKGEIKSTLPLDEGKITPDEITTLVHHPNKPILACFSHHPSTTSKRGMVHFWK